MTLSHGSLHEALKASCAVPGLFPPQTRGGLTLIDGSVLVEVPASVANDLAPDLPTVSLYLVRPSHRPKRYGTSAEIAVRAQALVHGELVRMQLEQSGFVLPLPVQDVGWLGFERGEDLANAGENLALEIGDELTAFLEAHTAGRTAAGRPEG